MKNNAAILMLFIDGLGIGNNDPLINPVYSGSSPFLVEMLNTCKAIDVSLNVPGLPQSATGQTTLLTGINAAKIMGRHMEGFPCPTLRKIIEEKNIFCQLKAISRKSTFANAYFTNSIREVKGLSYKSVTTVAALSAFGNVRKLKMLEAGKAVYHDITCEYLVSKGYKGNTITPEEAADHLADITTEYDFTLFEFFQTDRVGHTGDFNTAIKILHKLDRFIAKLMRYVTDKKINIILTSDHGNIEDMTIKTHTHAMVPFVVEGEFFKTKKIKLQVNSLADITPSLVNMLKR